jgi:hypothetical protein
MMANESMASSYRDEPRFEEPRLYADVLTNHRTDEWTEVYLGMAIALNAFGYLNRLPHMDRDGIPAYEVTAKWRSTAMRLES